jgi:hypothetical protein
VQQNRVPDSEKRCVLREHCIRTGIGVANEQVFLDDFDEVRAIEGGANDLANSLIHGRGIAVGEKELDVAERSEKRPRKPGSQEEIKIAVLNDILDALDLLFGHFACPRSKEPITRTSLTGYLVWLPP